MAITVNTYTKHDWVDNSSPDLEADVLNEIEAGIGDNNDAIKAIAATVVSQIVNDPDKIASMAALYAVNQALGNLSTTVTNINSNLSGKQNKITYIEARIQTIANVATLISPTSVVSGDIPPSINYVPLITEYSHADYVPVDVYAFNNAWWVYCSVAQTVIVRFYKMD